MPEISLHMTHNVGHTVWRGIEHRALWSLRSEIKLPHDTTIPPRQPSFIGERISLRRAKGSKRAREEER